MTKIKLCGMTRPEDIEAVNQYKADYIGFVFWEKSKRNVSKEQAGKLKALLDPEILAAGVFVDADPAYVAELLEEGIIDLAQLHGNESESYIKELRSLSGKPVIKAFTIRSEEDIKKAEESSADYVLLDSGKGSGMRFNWNYIKDMKRPYFLAGGLKIENVAEAIESLAPFAVDVSSGIESEGKKDPRKMKDFVDEVRK